MRLNWINRTWPMVLLALGLVCTSCSTGTAGPTMQDAADSGAESGKESAGEKPETGGAVDSGGGVSDGNTIFDSNKAPDGKPETDGRKAPDDKAVSGGLGLSDAGEKTGISSQLEAVCGSYFKAGDFRYRLVITPGGPDQANTISIAVQTRDLESDYRNWSNVMRTLQEVSLAYEVTGDSFRLEDDGMFNFNLDGSITLKDGTEAAGDYYSFEENLIMSDAFLRPLNDTDLIGLTREDMKLIRNEFYAVYGRTFQSQELKAYFGNQRWYRGLEGPDTFNDGILGEMVKRNVEFLKNAEESYNAEKAKALETSYKELPEAPYCALLPAKGEVFVSMASDAAQDCGIYYKARGIIARPLTFTVRQKQELEAGAVVEIDVSGLMDSAAPMSGNGKAWLKKAEDSQYGEYVLLRAPDGKETDGFYAEAGYDGDTGEYKLWNNSADTMFRVVYEGDIYVLKGASEEYYRHFDTSAGSLTESEGIYRLMDFKVNGQVNYEGNWIVTDRKGYLKALYFVGD